MNGSPNDIFLSGSVIKAANITDSLLRQCYFQFDADLVTFDLNAVILTE